MASSNTVQLDSHATSTLRYIRASMEAAASMSVPGSAGYAMGAVGSLAAVASSLPSLRLHWFAIWMSAAVVACILGTVLVLRPASLRALTRASMLTRKFALCLAPALFGGAVMTAVLWSSGHHAAIPGTWLLFYGCALVSTSVATMPKVATMGVLFAALGIIAFVLPATWHMLMLGLGFGGLHVVFGFLIGRSTHGDKT